MIKEVTIPNFVLRQGSKFSIKFTNDSGGVRNTYNLQLKVNNVTAPVYCGKYQCGVGSLLGSCVYEFIYDGTNFIKISDDIVASEISENSRYIKYKDGLIEQVIYSSTISFTMQTFNLLIPMTTTQYVAIPNFTNNAPDDRMFGMSYNKTTTYFQCYTPSSNFAPMWWYVKGY